MAGKDITEKILEAYDDVFSDIVNVLLFDGKEVIRPEELVDQNPKAAYKADGKVREIERDVAKRWMQQDIRIACEIKHVQEVLQLLNVMTGDSRYEQAYRDSKEEVPKNMCEVLDRIENKGRMEGRKEGRSEGLTAGRAEIFVLMQKLFEEGRLEDAKRAANDEAFQKAILEEFGLSTSV